MAVEVHGGTKIHDSKKAKKETKKTLEMAPTDPRFTIRKNIDINAVHVTSLEECLRRYRANKKTRTLVSTVLEV